MHMNKSWILILMAGVLAAISVLAADEARPASSAAANFTLCFISDTHLGWGDPKADPPRTPEQAEMKVRGTVTQMIAVSREPFPKRGPFKDLEAGPAGPVKGILLAGDLTDHGTQEEMEAFSRIFPATGIAMKDAVVPVYPVIGNHDGRVDGAARLALIARNRACYKAGSISAVSENGVHYAVDFGGVHLIAVGLYPSDIPDAQSPFKFGGVKAGEEWNDPQGALSFLKDYLHRVVKESGQPVIIMHHYGFDAFSTCDWNWWTPAIRRAYYEAIVDFNILAILHGHDHAARHYRWPDIKENPQEVRSLFGASPPPDLKSFDVFSAGNCGWIFRVQDNQLLAMHHEEKGWTASPEKMAVKPLVDGRQ